MICVNLCLDVETAGITHRKESFFGHMKDEIDVSGCTEFEQVREIIDDWVSMSYASLHVL